jgi:hypothetical protein
MLYFLLGGDYNDTMYVSYDHDDNYNVYYPGAWNMNYSLPDADYPQPLAVQNHVHLPEMLMTEWYDGAVDTATVEGYALGLQSYLIGAGGAVGGGILGYLLASLGLISLSSPTGALVGVIVGAIVGVIGAIITYWQQMQGYSSTAQWVRDVVTEQCTGDGWTWIWGDKVVSSFASILNPPIGQLADPRYSPDVYENQMYELHEFHRVTVGFDNTIRFQQSWGADRNQPQTFTVEASGQTQVNSGFFLG